MPKYVVLGATGSTGSELVKNLMKRQDVELHVYARSATKLEKVHPGISSTKNVKVHIGSITEMQVLEPCLRGAAVIFQTVAQNYNQPGCSVARETAQAIVKALEALRAEAGPQRFAAPKLVFLSSSSVDDAHFSKQPWAMRKFIYNASYYVYEDLRMATDYLRSEAPWLPLILASPGGIVKSEACGVRLDAEPSPTVGYADLAQGMVMMAEEDGWEGKYVGLVSFDRTRMDLLWENIWRYLLPGSITSFIPAAFPFLQWLGFF